MRSVPLALALALVLPGCIVDAPQDPPEAHPVESASVDDGSKDDSSAPRANATSEPKPEETPAPEAPTPPPSAPPAPVPPPGPTYATQRLFGNVTGVGVTTEAVGGHAAPPGSEVPPVATTVVAGTTALLVELRWTAAQPFDLDVVLTAPDYATGPSAEPNQSAPQESSVALWSGHRWTAAEGAPGQPDVARILVDDPGALALTGDWTVDIAAKGPAASAAYELAITHVRLAPPADGWSAFA